MKRLGDIVLSSISLVFLSPLLLGTAIFIKIRSPGPVFFKQRRIGKNGREFGIWKFRTMDVHSDKPRNATVTRQDDQRLFPGAALIRKFKIDELAQLINVFQGDMSIIGPRPTVLVDYERMNARQKGRNAVRPGLSGLAQVSGNTTLSWPDRIELDLAYIENMSVMTDLKIILKTFSLVLSGRADTHPYSDDEWS